MRLELRPYQLAAFEQAREAIRGGARSVLINAPTGSGKTVLQRLLMQSTLPRIREGSNHRALIYDAKQDILPILGGMDLRCPVRTFNPFDARGVAWDLAADITSPASALASRASRMRMAPLRASRFGTVSPGPATCGSTYSAGTCCVTNATV